MTVGLKNSDSPLAPISHDSVVRQRSYAHPAVPRDGEKMIYDRGRIQNPISLLRKRPFTARRVDRDMSDIGKSVASISYLPRDMIDPREKHCDYN